MNPTIRSGLSAALFMTACAGAASAQSRLYGVDGANLLELNPATGAVIGTTAMTGAPGTVGGLAYDANSGTMFLSSTSLDSLWTLNISTGVATQVGGFGVATTVVMHGLEIDDTGQLYGYSTNVADGARFFSINRNTGQATPISDPGFAGFGSMGYVAATGTMYISDTVGDQLLTINRTTGVVTPIGLHGFASQIGVGMAYDPTFGMLAVNNSGTDALYSLNLSTGAATLISNLTSGNMLSLAFVPIPAPGTIVLLGVAGMFASRRRWA
ncbi:MAG: PEP-CTERM sorting domain-containing protein [Phycisphaerales bacterium]